MSFKGWLKALNKRSHSTRRTRDRRAPVLLGGIHEWLLEDRCLPAITFPTPTVGSIGEVLYNGVTGQYEKTITITNNSPDQTIYAFLEGQISRLAIAPYEGTGAFNPFDPANQEYRAYIGYNDGGTEYAGLGPKSSITIPVPLAFWDSGRVCFSTDGDNQFASAPGAAAPGAPFYYHDFNTQAGFYCYIDPAHLDRLYFTPIYNSFDTTAPYQPSKANWKSPVELGLLKTGMAVNGANLPGGASTITVDAGHPEYVTLSGQATGAHATDQYVFTAVPNDNISPTARYVSTGYSLTTPQGTTTNGSVMWYHALKANIPNNDAPFQLTEVTFRGTFYDPNINIGTGFQYLLGNDPGNGIDANDFDLADYDISFVDSIDLPVALEASNASIPHPRGIDVGNATEAGNTVTIKTMAPHGFSVGQQVVITNYTGADAGYNGTFTILASGFTADTFQYTNTVTGLAPSTTIGTATTKTQAPFGWVGSGDQLKEFQDALANFAKRNPAGQNVNGLGQYFGGEGYPSYLVLEEGNLKLPSAQNLFLASPVVPGGLADFFFMKTFPDNSIIREPVYALTSAGDGPAQLSIGGDASHPSQGKFLGLNTITDANQYMLNEIIAPNVADGRSYTVTYLDNGVVKSAGNVIGMYRDKGEKIIGVQLDQKVPANAGSLVFTFKLPATDYAGKAMASLWYTWANYYATRVNTTPRSNVAGTIPIGSNILTLNDATTGLVPGMAVTGPALPTGCIVLDVGADNKTITLSTTATGAGTSFNFAKPAVAAIAGYDPKGFTPILDGFNFKSVADQARALAFAETVYVVMSAWSVSVPGGTQFGWNTLLTNIIGGNLGKNYLPNTTESIVQVLTVKSKSALRGVPDYTSSLYSDPAGWYPDPAVKTGGQQFNVYNLDPFVWFIHAKLGLTGYAFALDDDVGNVGAGGATHVDITVGGLNGLQNKDPYTPISPFGVVSTQAAAAPTKSSTLTNLSNPDIVYQIAQFDYPHNLLGTMINGQGVDQGTTVQFTQIDLDPRNTKLILSQPLTSATTDAQTFSFFGPLVFTGTVLGNGQPRDTIYLDSEDAYNTLLKLGTLQNIQVTGPGIAFGTVVTIKQVTKDTTSGIIKVQLNTNLQGGLISQPGSSYGYTFGAPVVGPVRDNGFEWAVVQNLTGKFNHGKQVSQNTVDWTFTDSTTNASWYAGIAANDSTYTSANLPAPQGLQVGFITGDSSISQVVTLAKGTYSLSLNAAQRAKQQTAQTLTVMLDGEAVGIIAPTGPSYQMFTFTLNVKSAGKHTLSFVGTQKSDSTALLDVVSIS